MTLRPNPKKKNKTLNLALFTVNICVNMPFQMSVRGDVQPSICSQIKKRLNLNLKLGQSQVKL